MHRSLLLALAILVSQSAFAQAPIHFHSANKELGLPVPNGVITERRYSVQQISGGVALFDCDNDGKLDIAVINESTLNEYKEGGGVPMLTLYHQDSGLKFKDVTTAAGLTHKGWGMGVSIADYDNDGLLDIYVTGFGGNALYHNIGNCKFEDVTAKAGVAAGGFSTGSAWADYDHDGRVDLFVSRYVHSEIDKLSQIKTNYKGLMVEAPWGESGETDLLFHNRGDGTFEEVAAKAGVSDPDKRIGLGAVWGDIDNDGWPDLYVGNDTMPNYLYRNKHDGTFEDIALFSGAAVGGDGKALASMGVDLGDFDHDGRLGIAVTTYAYEPIELHRNGGDKGFSDVTWAAKTGNATFRSVKWGIGFHDLDNDGFDDILVAAGHTYSEIDSLPGEPRFKEPLLLLRNAGNGTFEEIATAAGLNDEALESRRGIAFGDINNDGSIDAVIFNQGNPPSVFLNDTHSSNHRVMFALVGTKSNKAAIGARITLTSAGVTQIKEVKAGSGYLSQSDLRLHFGLGAATTIERVDITWPNGNHEVLTSVKPDAIYRIIEGSGIKSSVPLPPPAK